MRTNIISGVLGLALLAGAGPTGCDSAGPVNRDMSPGDAALSACSVPAPTSCPAPSPTFADVQPIFNSRCVICHNGTGPEWPLKDYHDIADWQDLIHDQLLDCSMPPPEAAVPMTVAERVSILTWIKCGFPQ